MYGRGRGGTGRLRYMPAGYGGYPGGIGDYASDCRASGECTLPQTADDAYCRASGQCTEPSPSASQWPGWVPPWLTNQFIRALPAGPAPPRSPAPSPVVNRSDWWNLPSWFRGDLSDLRKRQRGGWNWGRNPPVGMNGLGGDPNCDSGMPYDVNGDPCSSPIYSPFSPDPVSYTPVMVPPPVAPSSLMLPSNMSAVTFADGTKGFFDPADGTYYDSQGNDVTGYVQNFGGAKVTGAASAASIAAAEGISASAPKSSSGVSITLPSLGPGAAPRVAAPGYSMMPSSMFPSLPSLGSSGTSTLFLLGGAALVAMVALGGGGRRR